MKSATARGGNAKPATVSGAGLALRAEDVGFEPTKVSLAGFQDRCTRPLCESSVGEVTRKGLMAKIQEKLLLTKQEVRATAQ